jgi:hypothetical protein
MIMCERASMPADAGALWLDERAAISCSSLARGRALAKLQVANRSTARHVGRAGRVERAQPRLAIAPASSSLQEIIQLRRSTGHPVLLAEDGGSRRLRRDRDHRRLPGSRLGGRASPVGPGVGPAAIACRWHNVPLA